MPSNSEQEREQDHSILSLRACCGAEHQFRGWHSGFSENGASFLGPTDILEMCPQSLLRGLWKL